LENIRHIIPLKGAAPVPPSAKPGGVPKAMPLSDD